MGEQEDRNIFTMFEQELRNFRQSTIYLDSLLSQIQGFNNMQRTKVGTSAHDIVITAFLFKRAFEEAYQYWFREKDEAIAILKGPIDQELMPTPSKYLEAGVKALLFPIRYFQDNIYGIFLYLNGSSVGRDTSMCQCLGFSEFFVGDLDVVKLHNVLKDDRLTNKIVLQELSLSANEVDTISENALLQVFNKILKMRDFYSKIGVEQYNSLISGDMKKLLTKAQMPESNLDDKDYSRLNRALLEAAYPKEIRKDGFLNTRGNYIGNLIDKKLPKYREWFFEMRRLRNRVKSGNPLSSGFKNQRFGVIFNDFNGASSNLKSSLDGIISVDTFVEAFKQSTEISELALNYAKDKMSLQKVEMLS